MNESAAFEPKKGLAYRKIQDEMVLVDPETNLLLRLNETGAFIWERLASAPFERIVQGLAETYEVSSTDAAADTQSFIDLLLEKKLIVRTGVKK